MEKKKHIIALMYDFDKTLCAKDMQEYSFIPNIGMKADEFWFEANKISVKNNMDRILAYMYLMLKTAKKKDLPITKEAFQELGQDVVLYKGVKSWFKRINDYGRSLGVEIEHYILSSGLKKLLKEHQSQKNLKRFMRVNSTTMKEEMLTGHNKQSTSQLKHNFYLEFLKVF